MLCPIVAFGMPLILSWEIEQGQGLGGETEVLNVLLWKTILEEQLHSCLKR